MNDEKRPDPSEEALIVSREDEPRATGNATGLRGIQHVPEADPRTEA